jgi:8-oxo-dGTP pyrophosphatase MutT (NUDIX family)
MPTTAMEPLCCSETAIEAAIREIREELGNDALAVDVLGELPTVPGKNGKAVSPILGFLPDIDVNAAHLSRSTAEVEAVFTVPLFPTLATPEFEMFKEYNLPVYRPPEARGVKIWGLTAFVMHGVMEDIVIPAIGSNL